MAAGPSIQEATRLVRRTLLWALLAAGLVASVFLATILFAESASHAASARLLAAQRAVDAVLLADERLTMSANLAAASGQERWIARYEANIPVIDEAIAEAAALAPPQAAARFDAETRIANDRLVAMERAAFAAVRAGDLARARAILDGAAYAEQKRVLSEGADRFTASVMDHVRAELDAARMLAKIAPAILCVLIVAGVLLSWRRLGAAVLRSEAAIHEAQGVIHDLTLSDGLTGVPNRRALGEHLKAAVARADRSRTKVALLLIDIDGFKQVNDQHGLVVGDLAIKEIARRLSELLRQGEYRARYGGDEFAVVVEFASEAAVRRIAQSVVEALCQPMRLAEVTVQVRASVGVALFPTVARTDEDLIGKAELALMSAKRDGRGAVRVCDLGMEVGAFEREELAAELRANVSGLRPYFHPIVDLRSGAVVGLEILARWRHPKRGLLEPAAFLPIAQSAGLMNELTLAMLKGACEAARCMPGQVMLSLNVAAQQVQDDWLVGAVRAVLADTAFAPSRLELEITNNALLADLAEAKRVITALKGLGVRVALDNFGVGYASLGYLAELPFDTVKIDASLVRTLAERAESVKIVTAIVGLAQHLGARSVAECVETEQQAALLRSMGCDAAQGFYYAKPMPAAEAALALAPKAAARAIA